MEVDLNNLRFIRFEAYHPHLTFSDQETTHFLHPEGKVLKSMNGAEEALFKIGKEAYMLLPKSKKTKTKTKTKTKDDFDSYTFIYFYSIESARRMFDSFDDDADINIFPGNIDELNWDWNIASNSQILNLAWSLFAEKWQAIGILKC